MIKVLGAGVIGLTTAIELHKHYPVVIVSKYFPGQDEELDPIYTSSKAGAIWSSWADPQDTRQIGNISFKNESKEWDKKTWKKMFELYQMHPQLFRLVPEDIVYDKKPQDWQQPWYTSVLPGFKFLEKNELPLG